MSLANFKSCFLNKKKLICDFTLPNCWVIGWLYLFAKNQFSIARFLVMAKLGTPFLSYPGVILPIWLFWFQQGLDILLMGIVDVSVNRQSWNTSFKLSFCYCPLFCHILVDVKYLVNLLIFRGHHKTPCDIFFSYPE